MAAGGVATDVVWRRRKDRAMSVVVVVVVLDEDVVVAVGLQVELQMANMLKKMIVVGGRKTWVWFLKRRKRGIQCLTLGDDVRA